MKYRKTHLACLGLAFVAFSRGINGVPSEYYRLSHFGFVCVALMPLAIKSVWMPVLASAGFEFAFCFGNVISFTRVELSIFAASLSGLGMFLGLAVDRAIKRATEKSTATSGSAEGEKAVLSKNSDDVAEP